MTATKIPPAYLTITKHLAFATFKKIQNHTKEDITLTLNDMIGNQNQYEKVEKTCLQKEELEVMRLNQGDILILYDISKPEKSLLGKMQNSKEISWYDTSYDEFLTSLKSPNFKNDVYFVFQKKT